MTTAGDGGRGEGAADDRERRRPSVPGTGTMGGRSRTIAARGEVHRLPVRVFSRSRCASYYSFVLCL